MTDQLSPSTRPGVRPTPRPSASPTPAASAEEGRPLSVSAVAAGLGAPALGLFLIWVVGLVGWFAANGGSTGTTRSVLRVGADAWLLAHGAHLEVTTPHGLVTVTASPLGLTLLCLFLVFRLGRWAGRSSMPEDLVGVGLATVVLAGTYGVVAFVTAFVAGAPGAEPGLALSLLGGVLVGGIGGGLGLVVGAGHLGHVRRLVPVPALSVAYAAVAAVLLVAAAGAFLTAVSLAVHGSAAAEVVEQLDLDLLGGGLSLLLLVLISPNVALLGGAYLVGPGFALGTGTVVSPAEVDLGPVPALPVLAAIPGDGPAPGWVSVLLTVPALVAVVAAVLAGRALPTTSWRDGALRGLGGGIGGAVLLTLATSWAGGAIGSGRMAELGAPVGALLLWSTGSLGLGGLVGGLGATWWARRLELDTADSGPRPSLRHSLRRSLGRRTAKKPPVVSIYGTPRLSQRLRDRLAGRRPDGPGRPAVPDDEADDEAGDEAGHGPDRDVEHTVVVDGRTGDQA